jgi:hypothetical protein
LEIHLHSPFLIEIVSVTKSCLVFVAGMNRADDELVMLGIISGFDIRLRIDILSWRPIGEANGKKIRFSS